MRLIYKNRSIFSISNVKDYIVEKQKIMQQAQKVNPIFYEQTFAKMYHRHLREQKQTAKNIRQLNTICLLEKNPARKIAQYFQRLSKSFSENLLTECFVAFGKAHTISKLDNASTLDPNQYRLFLLPEFVNLIEEFKYGLKKEKISMANVIRISESLVEAQYVDYQVINLLLIYIEKVLTGKSTPSPIFEERLYQIEKEGYYKQSEDQFRKAVLQSQDLTTAIQLIRNVVSKEIIKQEIHSKSTAYRIQEIHQLINDIEQTNTHFERLVEGILNIRRGYSKMVKFSAKQSVARNPALNLELLELEEKMLSSRYLNTNDIQNPSLFENNGYEAKRVEEIMLRILEADDLNNIFWMVDKNVTVKEVPVNDFQMRCKLMNQFLNMLVGFANVDKRVYNAIDGTSLIDLKWEKTLLQTKLENTEQPNDKLHVSRIFRKVYRDVYQHFINQMPNYKLFYQQTSKLKQLAPFLDALCKVGLQSEAIEQFKTINLAEQNMSQYSACQFQSLMSVLNFLACYVKMQQCLPQLIVQLQKYSQIELNSKINLPLKFTVNCLNFIMQSKLNLEEDLSLQNTYKTFLTVLEKKYQIRYGNGNDSQDDLALTEASKILALEIPEKYAENARYLSYLQSIYSNVYKNNPFDQIVKEMTFKWANLHLHENNGNPVIKTGYKNGKPTGIVLANSEEITFYSNLYSGDFNSYLLRLQKSYRISLTGLSATQFYFLNYSHPKQFIFKEKEEIAQIFHRIFNKEDQSLQALLENISNIFEDLRTQISNESFIIFNKIELKLVFIKKSYQLELTAETNEQYITEMAKLVIELSDLKKDLNLLKKVLKKPQLEPAFEACKNYISEYLQKLKDLNIFQKVEGSKDEKGRLVNLKGRRLTIETLEEDLSEGYLGKVGEQLINSEYFYDKTYCEYEDWKKLIDKHYLCENISVSELSRQGKMLISRFCPSATNSISLLPFVKHSQRIKIIEFNKGSLPEENENLKSDDGLSAADEIELNKIIVLQNFKHELKSTKNKEEIVDYILGFRFLNDLKEEEFVSSEKLLVRSGEEYFNFLESKEDKFLEDSPYVTYILSKINRTSNIKELLYQRKHLRIKNRARFQLGEITAKQYYAEINNLEDSIIAALEGLKDKLFDNVNDLTLLSGSLKMIQIKTEDLQEFQRLFKRHLTFQKAFDQDFIYAGGNYDLALNFKRGRAQNTLQKFALLKKLADGKSITNLDKSNFERWIKDVQRNTKQYVIYDKFTNLQVKDISIEDQQRLKLRSTTLLSNKDMLLIDLILELNNFLDGSTLFNIEKQIKGNFYLALYNVSPSLYLSSNNKEFYHLCLQKEKAILDQKSQLTKDQLDQLETMFKTFKTEGYAERNRYQVLCKQFRTDIEQMNTQKQRIDFITEYIRLLEQEFFMEYNPDLIKDHKNKKIEELWKECFHSSGHNVSGELLKKVCTMLLMRFEGIGKSVPPFFGVFILKLLSHEGVDELIKESIIAGLEYHKIGLDIDSADLRQLFKRSSRELKSLGEIDSEIRKVCNKNFAESMSKRVSQLS